MHVEFRHDRSEQGTRNPLGCIDTDHRHRHRRPLGLDESRSLRKLEMVATIPSLNHPDDGEWRFGSAVAYAVGRARIHTAPAPSGGQSAYAHFGYRHREPHLTHPQRQRARSVTPRPLQSGSAVRSGHLDGVPPGMHRDRRPLADEVSVESRNPEHLGQPSSGEDLVKERVQAQPAPKAASDVVHDCRVGGHGRAPELRCIVLRIGQARAPDDAVPPNPVGDPDHRPENGNLS
jgi:hypothetical protein